MVSKSQKLVSTFLLVFLVSCGSDEPAHEDSACADAEVETYVAGMTKSTEKGLYAVTLVEADPDPPEKGDNAWLLQIKAEESPLDDADVVLTPFMPEHGHGSSPAEINASAGGDGFYQAEGINFSMPGIWETTISVQAPEGDKDSTVFTFCIEG